MNAYVHLTNKYIQLYHKNLGTYMYLFILMHFFGRYNLLSTHTCESSSFSLSPHFLSLLLTNATWALAEVLNLCFSLHFFSLPVSRLSYSHSLFHSSLFLFKVSISFPCNHFHFVKVRMNFFSLFARSI